MKRIVPTLVLAAALTLANGVALAEEVRFTLPTADLKACVAPVYPKAALRKGEEGTVFLGVQVDENGAVLDTKILLSSGSAALDEAAQHAYRRCRYAPGTVNGRAASMWAPVQYIWTIEPSNGKLIAGLKQAALDGNAQARYVLSVIIASHAKTDEERAAAFKLVSIAAEGGEPMAQLSLARSYENGKQITRDMELARLWYAKAAAQGNVVAIDHLRLIGEAASRDAQ
jgi:TonB family protein